MSYGVESSTLKGLVYVCWAIQRSQVYLLGHSWGGFTGCAYLSSRMASTVAGFVAICPVVSFPLIQQELYAQVSKKIGMSGSPTARKELSSIGRPPYPDIDDFIRLQGLAIEAQEDPYRYISAKDLSRYTGSSIDTNHCLAVQTHIAASLWPKPYTLDLTASLEMLATPLLMIAGGLDSAVPMTSVRMAFSAYGKSCPDVIKQWLLLEHGNHLPFTEPANGQRGMDAVTAFIKVIEEKKGRLS